MIFELLVLLLFLPLLLLLLFSHIQVWWYTNKCRGAEDNIPAMLWIGVQNY